MRDYYVSEGVKALFAVYLKEKTEESFFKALNEFSRENQINSQEIKDEALREFKEELSKLATTDLLNAKIDTVNARIDKVEASLNARLDSFRTEIKTYVIILAVLMFILQPAIFDFIKSIFK
ncbi:TPA: hypothetical protein RZK24_001137 [Campylobacter coli]|uniref:hypothetical protein n=1 Tax=Campylobacter coli TaxID=195 RepID=UPI0009302484|nr:hypothetical protein [Campylobacter coli]HEB7570375.1 hypothetical protein [Campylobacter coli]HEB9306508.1 hypothetical protein [Campylobacter coli]HEB9318382.1 hypothetical protein [Campylobacter coli]HEC1726617.1 hypothetical protein [Campylobacter coli]